MLVFPRRRRKTNDVALVSFLQISKSESQHSFPHFISHLWTPHATTRKKRETAAAAADFFFPSTCQKSRNDVMTTCLSRPQRLKTDITEKGGGFSLSLSSLLSKKRKKERHFYSTSFFNRCRNARLSQIYVQIWATAAI